MNKSLIRLIFAFSAVALLFAGCKKDVDEDNLIGRWRCENDGYYYTFLDDGSGRCADSRDRGLNFSWDLDRDNLTINYSSNGDLPKPGREEWIIKKLTSTYMEAYEVGLADITYKFEKQ